MSLNQGTVTDVAIPGPGPFGFRLAGGKDFGLPLHVSKITVGGKAQQAQLREKDVILMINGIDISFCTHLDAQNKIKAAFHDDLHLKTQRGDTRVWNPVSKDDSTGAYKVSLKANNNQEFMHPGSKSNFAPKGYGSSQPAAPVRSVAPPAPGPGRGSASVVHLQFNSPAGLYSEQNIAETFKGQTEGMIDESVGNDEYQPQPYQPMRDTGFSPKPGEVSATMVEPEPGQEIKYGGYINPGAQSRSFKMLQALVADEVEEDSPPTDSPDKPVAVETPTQNGGAVPHQATPASIRPVGVRSVKPPASRAQPVSPGQQVRDLPNCAVCQSNIMPSSHTPTYSQPATQTPQVYSSPQSYNSPSSYAPPPPPPAPPASRPQPPSQVAANRPRAPQAVTGGAPPNKARQVVSQPKAGGGDQYCDGCRQIIKGTVVTALNKSWHPDHFVCAHCHDSLKNQGFVEHDNKVYCQTDYNRLYAPRCFKCGQSIAGNCVTAMGHSYHPEHFTCAECDAPIGDQQFMVNNGQPYCRKDHEALFSHRCASCNFTVDAGDPWVEAMDKCYHSNCFNCSICQTPLEGQKFYAKNGRPVCQTHAY